MDTIARREIKYLLPSWRVPSLRKDLAALLEVDPHGAGSPPGYLVRSLYFESHSLLTLKEKQAGLFARYKLRVRGYPPLTRESQLVLEIKVKRGSALAKERTTIDADELDLLVASRHASLLDRRGDDPVVRRFVAGRVSRGAVLPLLVDYWREAYVHASRDVYQRATIDQDMRTAPCERFFDPPPLARPFAEGQAILEVKFCGATPPSWLGLITRKHHLDPRALSKFANACERTYAAFG